MAGGGTFRTDQVEFAVIEEAIEGQCPNTVDGNLGLITGGITLPDTEFDWDFFYGIGRLGRGRKDAYKGNQSFMGSVSQMYVLFDESRMILEMILGELSTDVTTLAGTNPGVITGVTETTMTDSGENFESGLSVKDGNYAVFSGISVGYIENETGTGNAVVTVWPTPNRATGGGVDAGGWNGPMPAVGDAYEVRKTESVGVASGDKFAVGLQRLNSMSWAVRHRNTINQGTTSVGSNLTVNYLGGKVNRATLSAKQGEKLMLALDEVMFRDLLHDSNLPSTSVAKYAAIGSGATGTKRPTATHPTEEPLEFSEGTIALFELGNTFARIRDFSLIINNNLTEERYISTVAVAGATKITQIPYELIEGNREITLELTAVMETREYWEHLMREGQNDALSAKTGFDIMLTFQANSAGTEFLYIQAPAQASPTLVDSIDGSTALSAAGTNMGCVFTAAPHEIPEGSEPLIAVRMSLNLPTIAIRFDDA